MPDWKLQGVWTESCTCDITCICNLDPTAPPTQGYCDVAFCFDLKEGEVDGVEIRDIPVAWFVNLPGAFAGGNGSCRLYISDKATPEQRAALEPIFRGQRGGVWVTFAGIIDTWHDTQYVPIDVTEEGDTRTVTVGDVGKIVATTVRNHRGEEVAVYDPPLLAAASIHKFVISRGSESEWSDPDLKKFQGNHAATSEFFWTSDGAEDPAYIPA